MEIKKKIVNIRAGWNLYLAGETDTLALTRSEICRACPFAAVGTFEKFMPDKTLKDIQGLKCKKCGCPLSAKLRSENEICPLGKW